MSELSYKKLQEQGVFDVPYRAFKYMQSQQDKIDLLEKELTKTQAFLNKQNHIKQAKIDELQARVDCLKGSVDWHIEDCELALSMNKNDVWSGGQLEILRAIKKRLEDMLKGNKDEN